MCGYRCAFMCAFALRNIMCTLHRAWSRRLSSLAWDTLAVSHRVPMRTVHDVQTFAVCARQDALFRHKQLSLYPLYPIMRDRFRGWVIRVVGVVAGFRSRAGGRFPSEPADLGEDLSLHDQVT